MLAGLTIKKRNAGRRKVRRKDADLGKSPGEFERIDANASPRIIDAMSLLRLQSAHHQAGLGSNPVFPAMRLDEIAVVCRLSIPQANLFKLVRAGVVLHDLFAPNEIGIG